MGLNAFTNLNNRTIPVIRMGLEAKEKASSPSMGSPTIKYKVSASGILKPNKNE